jgi:hypothetical protein
MGMVRRTARRAGRRSALITTAVVGGAMAASSKKRQAAEDQKVQAQKDAQNIEDKQEQATSDPVQKLKERLANGEITLEEYNKILEALSK